MLAIFIFSLFLSPKAIAIEGCGTTPDNEKTLFEIAEEVVNACDQNLKDHYADLYEAEVKALNNYLAHLEPQIKKVAVKSNKMIIDCGVETMRKIETVVECRRLSALRRATEARLDRLENWKKSLSEKIVADANLSTDHHAPPCASSTEFSELAPIKNFNPHLYSRWEDCRK